MIDQNPFKCCSSCSSSNLWIVSMIPSDREVAGRLFYTLSPRYDSLEECRDSYSSFIGGFND